MRSNSKSSNIVSEPFGYSFSLISLFSFDWFHQYFLFTWWTWLEVFLTDSSALFIWCVLDNLLCLVSSRRSSVVLLLIGSCCWTKDCLWFHCWDWIVDLLQSRLLLSYQWSVFLTGVSIGVSLILFLAHRRIFSWCSVGVSPDLVSADRCSSCFSLIVCSCWSCFI